MVFQLSERSPYVVDIFSTSRRRVHSFELPVNAVEARNRLLQVYDEEVTIRRTLPPSLKARQGPSRRGERIRRLSSRLSCPIQRNAGLTEALLVAPTELGKKQEMPELANSLEKRRATVEPWPGPGKLLVQLAASSALSGTRSLHRRPDAHTKSTIQTSARKKCQPARS